MTQDEATALLVRCEKLLANAQYWCVPYGPEGVQCVRDMRDTLAAIYDFLGTPPGDRLAVSPTESRSL